MFTRAFRKNRLNTSVYLFIITLSPIFLNAEKTLPAISLTDPVGAASSIANDIISSANIYEQRQFYHSKKKEELERFQKERANALRTINELKKNLSNKKTELHQKNLNTEDLSSKINEILEVFSDQIYTWDAYRDDFEDHLSVLDNNKDFFSEDLFKKKFEFIENRSKFSPTDLFNSEQEILSIRQKIDNTLQKKYAADCRRVDDDANLDTIKKDVIDVKKKAYKNTLASEKADIYDKIFVEYEKELSFRKQELFKLQSAKSKSCCEFLAKELDFLKFKLKKVEEIEKKIKPRVFASQKDVDEKKIILQTEEQKLTLEKENINKEIEEKKRQRDVLNNDLNQQKSRLKAKKELSEKDSEITYDSDLKQDIFTLEIKILKLKYEADHLESQMQELELKKKQKQLLRDEAIFRYHQVQAMYLNSNLNNDEKEFSSSLNSIKIAVNSEIKKQQENMWISIVNIDNMLSVETSTKKAILKSRREELFNIKNSLFLDKRKALQEVYDYLTKAEEAVDERIKTVNNMRLLTQSLNKQKLDLQDHLENLNKDINALDGVQYLWRRSASAITKDNLEDAAKDLDSFIKKLFWESKDKLNPVVIVRRLIQVPFDFYLGFLLLLIIFSFLSLLINFFIRQIRDYTNQALVDQSSRMENRYALFLLICLNLSTERYLLAYSWLFIHIFIKTGAALFGFSFKFIDPYYISIFYLISIFFWINTASKFLALFHSFNKKMNYSFFSEKTSIKTMFLLNCLFYCSAIILPLWLAVSSYSLYFRESVLGVVLMAAHRLLSVLIIFFFLDRDDVVALLPRWGYFSLLLHEFVEQFFYPILLFCTSIYIIFSPYIGYSCLGWYLIFMVPFSGLILLGGYLVQAYNRSFTQQLFFSDSDIESEVVEKFEHARMLYGCYIIISFITIWIAVYAILSKMWVGDFNLFFLWQQVSEKLTVSFGERGNFGLVEIFKFFAFIFGGYFLSSLIDQLVLKRVFDIFKLEAGLENTISKIFQYMAVVLSVILALGAINFGNLVVYLFTALLLGVGIGTREQIADIFAGILILLERQIEKDHYIEFNEDKTNYRGSVHKMSIRSTTIRTVRNFFVSVPNRLLISRPIINWGAGRAAVGMEFDVKVAFGADPEEICTIIKQIIYENSSVMRVPAALVRLEEFTEFGMVFFARAFLHARRVREQWDIAANIRLEIIKTFKAKNIALAYPHRTILIQHKSDLIPEDEQAIKIRLDEECEDKSL